MVRLSICQISAGLVSKRRFFVALAALLAAGGCSSEREGAKLVRGEGFVSYANKSELPECAGSLVGKVVYIEETKETFRCDPGGYTRLSVEDIIPDQETVAVQGRVMLDKFVGVAGNDLVPVEGLDVFTWINGEKVTVKTNAEGYYRFTGVPVVGDQAGVENSSVQIYMNSVESGFVADLDLNSVTDQGFLASVSVDASEAVLTRLGHQVDVGTSTVYEFGLYFDLSLHRYAIHAAPGWSAGTVGRWLAGTAPGTSFYMTDPAASISMNFTMPVDTDYAGTDFVTLLDSSGQKVEATGTWNEQKTLFTLDPAADLTADETDGKMYRLVFNKGVRAFSSVSGRVYELFGTYLDLEFSVQGSALTRLATQAPYWAPQYTASDISYSFDSAEVCVHRRVSSSTITDVDDCDEGKIITMGWNDVEGAESFKLYCRNSKNNQAGKWSDVTERWDPVQAADGRWFANLAANAADGIFADGACNSDTKLSAGEQIQFIVTAVDADGTESERTFAAPLVVTDTRAPRLSAVSVDDTAPTEGLEEVLALAGTFMKHLLVTFSEDMDAVSPDAAPVLTEISPRISSATVAETAESGVDAFSKVWTSKTTWRANLTSVYALPSTSLSAEAVIGVDELKVADASGFMVGDEIAVFNDAQDIALVSISDVDTVSNVLKLGSSIARRIASGAQVRVASSQNMSYFSGTLTAAATGGSFTVSAADAARFAPLAGNGVQVFLLRLRSDGQSDYDVDSCIIDTVDTTSGVITCTVATSFSGPFPAGSLVSRVNPSNDEPIFRSGIDLDVQQDVEFDARSVAGVTVSANDTVLDTTVTLSDTSGLRVNDWVRLGSNGFTGAATTLASGVSSGLAVSMDTAAAHNFVVGDTVVIGAGTSAAEVCTVLVVTDSDTFACDLTSNHDAAANVALSIADEVLQIQSISGQTVTFTSTTSYLHRANDTVTLLATAWITANTNEVDSVLVGDSVLFGFWTGSRFYSETVRRAEVLDVDTANDRILLGAPGSSDSPSTGFRIPSGGMKVVALGDAVMVSGATDTNGSAMSTTVGQYLNLGNEEVW